MSEEQSLQLPEQARCDSCGYSLHALQANRCPECGLRFDRFTLLVRLRGQHAKLPFDEVAAKWLSPPPWWATIVATLSAVARPFPESIIPNRHDVVPSLPAQMLFSVATATLLLKLIDRRKVPARYNLSQAAKGRFGKNWVALPIACLLSFPVLGDHLSMHLAFVASLPQANALAQQVIAARKPLPDRRVGFYSAAFIYPLPDGMIFRISSSPTSGFAYTTTGQAPLCRSWAEPMGGGWYAFADQ